MTLLEVFSLAAVLLFIVLLLMEVTAVIIALIDCKKCHSGGKKE